MKQKIYRIIIFGIGVVFCFVGIAATFEGSLENDISLRQSIAITLLGIYLMHYSVTGYRSILKAFKRKDKKKKGGE